MGSGSGVGPQVRDRGSPQGRGGWWGLLFVPPRRDGPGVSQGICRRVSIPRCFGLGVVESWNPLSWEGPTGITGPAPGPAGTPTIPSVQPWGLFLQTPGQRAARGSQALEMLSGSPREAGHGVCGVKHHHHPDVFLAKLPLPTPGLMCFPEESDLLPPQPVPGPSKHLVMKPSASPVCWDFRIGVDLYFYPCRGPSNAELQGAQSFLTAITNTENSS